MAYVFHRVGFAVIAGKWWMIEMPQHFSTFYLVDE